jgi:xylan 1,4-beta-xylosidase
VKLPPDFGSKAQVIHYRIDDTHSNAYTKWLELGSPQNPDARMLAELKAAMELEMLEPTKLIDITNDEATLKFDLPRSGLSLVVLNR